MIQIAALFVDPKGAYSGLPGIDCWDEARDARLYDGPHPVVAHPPCSTWCQLASVNEKRYGHQIGSDGGCFASALDSVMRWGGVLEHPAETIAWQRFGLPRPPRDGWARTFCGGWVTCVEQGMYGHRARKATWLYAFGCELPRLRWGRAEARATVSFCRNHGGGDLPRLSKREAKATPPEFRDVLLAMARSARALHDEGPGRLTPTGPLGARQPASRPSSVTGTERPATPAACPHDGAVSTVPK